MSRRAVIIERRPIFDLRGATPNTARANDSASRDADPPAARARPVQRVDAQLRELMDRVLSRETAEAVLAQ
jgi:hypothetical protein